jgi:hypothetical protein
MISTATILALLKSQASFAALAAAILNYAMAERARQFEIVREMGTLACHIENCRLLGQDCSALQKQYEQLAKLVKA